MLSLKMYMLTGISAQIHYYNHIGRPTCQHAIKIHYVQIAFVSETEMKILTNYLSTGYITRPPLRQKMSNA